MPFRVFAFGDLADGSWGAAWIPSGSDQAALLGFTGGSGEASHQLDGDQASEPWHLTAGATELTLEGLGEPVSSEGPDEASGFDQLCQVTGVLAGESGQKDITCLGWRSARSEPPTWGHLESMRLAAAWFEQNEGFALLAERPEGGRGQERDRITAAVFASTGAKPVADPRLSTTYDGSERPIRASVELWIESEDDGETQYPRRAIGEALAPPAQASARALALDARPFRWYSGGMEGAGIYLFGRAI